MDKAMRAALDRWLTTPPEYDDDECEYNCASCGACEIIIAELTPIVYNKLISHIPNLGEVLHV